MAPENFTISGSVLKYDVNNVCGYWDKHRVDASAVSPGASGATEQVVGDSLYWLLDNAGETLFFSRKIHSNWSPTTDPVLTVDVALSGNEDANDDIQAEATFEYYREHESMGGKSQTVSIDHDIGNYNAVGDMHTLNFVLDYDDPGNVLTVGDIVKVKFRLDVVGGVGNVAGVRFLYANLRYKACEPEEETLGEVPVSG
jgi:hypothetical protein